MESTLTLTYDQISGRVGVFLGYGRGAKAGDPAWTAQQQALIDDCVSSGLRQFYFPPPIEGQESSYDWSFLKPLASVPFASGAQTIPLPDDFGGFEGQITLKSTQSQTWWPIDIRNEGTVRQLYSETPSSTGRPWAAALQWNKGTGPTQGQRAQLFLFPAADTNYTLQFQYYILPDYLTQAFPFAYGGAAHTETVLESCLQRAELQLDDASSVHADEFNRRLMASINLDRRNKPQLTGYNRDNSDFVQRWGRDHTNDRILVNGTQY